MEQHFIMIVYWRMVVSRTLTIYPDHFLTYSSYSLGLYMSWKSAHNILLFANKQTMLNNMFMISFSFSHYNKTGRNIDTTVTMNYCCLLLISVAHLSGNWPCWMFCYNVLLSHQYA